MLRAQRHRTPGLRDFAFRPNALKEIVKVITQGSLSTLAVFVYRPYRYLLANAVCASASPSTALGVPRCRAGYSPIRGGSGFSLSRIARNFRMRGDSGKRSNPHSVPRAATPLHVSRAGRTPALFVRADLGNSRIAPGARAGAAWRP
jgi:hypothetical protein